MSDDLPASSKAINLSRRKRQKAAIVQGARRAQERIEPYATVFRITVRQLEKNRFARLGAVLVACLALIAIFADVLASELPIVCGLDGHVYVLPNVSPPRELAGYDCARIADEGGWQIAPLVRFGPRQIASRGRIETLRAPLALPGHWLGTDAHGRDVAARVIHGTRTALAFGTIAVLAFAGIGVLLGASSGFFGGLLDAVVSRVIETLTAFPTLILVLVVQSVVRNPSLVTLLVTIGLTRWTEVARLVRAEVILVSAQEYVTAARALGARPWRILRRDVLPNAVAPVLVSATFGVASVVLIEAALDFLRVGVPDSVASWGETLSEARENAGAWWLLAFPGAMLFTTVAALNLVGEALRDALDPRLRDAVRIAGSAEERRGGGIGGGGRADRDGSEGAVPPSAAAFEDSTHA